MKTSHILILVGIIVAVGVVYVKFFHHKPHSARVSAQVAVAAKKKGKGGWRHRLSHVASGVAHTALATSGIPGAGQIGFVAGI